MIKPKPSSCRSKCNFQKEIIPRFFFWDGSINVILKSTRYFSFHSSSLRVACSCAFLCKKGSFLTTSTRFSPICLISPSDESSLSQAFHEFAIGILQNFRRGLMTVMLRLQYSRDYAITLLIFAEHLLDSLVKKRAGSQAENFK